MRLKPDRDHRTSDVATKTQPLDRDEKCPVLNSQDNSDAKLIRDIAPPTSSCAPSHLDTDEHHPSALRHAVPFSALPHDALRTQTPELTVSVHVRTTSDAVHSVVPQYDNPEHRPSALRHDMPFFSYATRCLEGDVPILCSCPFDV